MHHTKFSTELQVEEANGVWIITYLFYNIITTGIYLIIN